MHQGNGGSNHHAARGGIISRARATSVRRELGLAALESNTSEVPVKIQSTANRSKCIHALIRNGHDIVGNVPAQNP
jgi:hypothetical protein